MKVLTANDVQCIYTKDVHCV